jgi:putative tryptophan/tyrosine transport system substrate-binding protein
MNRRDIITMMGGAALAWPNSTWAQQHSGMRRIGVLMPSANDAGGRAEAAALVQGLGALNWKEGDNLLIDWRKSSDDSVLYWRYAAELIALDPEVLIALGTASVEALRRQTRSIPIVFALVSDPVALGYVQSLPHPGGNITGFSAYDQPMVGKWLQMLTQITPPVARVAVLYNPATQPNADLMMHAVEQAAPSLKVAVQDAPCRDDAEIEAMMARLAHEERGGLLVLPDSFTVDHHVAIVGLAARYRLPAVYFARVFAASGGLMSYGTDDLDSIRRVASYVDRILKGEKAGDLPVQNPTKFQLVINLNTAKTLGVTFPTTLLATADEVIE